MDTMHARKMACERLRALVQDCIAKHLYKGAVFFADKLLTLSDNSPSDLYLLAQVRRSYGFVGVGSPMRLNIVGVD